MDYLVVRCAFCTRRYLVEIEGIDAWWASCPCGAHGFAEDDGGLGVDADSRPGFTVKEVSSGLWGEALLSDPAVVYVDEWARRWYVFWVLPQG
ncbi:MAG TPA: hypothetical protein PLS81_01455 [Deltaproteobacteria bacterium]|nr:hypothetical protein [Deltaproteobacteria bacterium]HOM28109.1 hypothetical protein [Deltaproteobacteria bacterium]HPP81402.1 hypothetical protein [Deltaproteobacteria bacterium]